MPWLEAYDSHIDFDEYSMETMVIYVVLMNVYIITKRKRLVSWVQKVTARRYFGQVNQINLIGPMKPTSFFW